MLVRTYARLATVALVATSVVGFSEVWGFDPLTGFYHVGVGALFAYAGFGERNPTTARRMVGGLGVLLVVTKTVTVLASLVWFGVLEHGPVEITCLVLGIGSILAARHLPDGDETGVRRGGTRGRP